ncbi:hypothetical protein MRX96_011253 [Rhipicephalus microplus]
MEGRSSGYAGQGLVRGTGALIFPAFEDFERRSSICCWSCALLSNALGRLKRKLGTHTDATGLRSSPQGPWVYSKYDSVVAVRTHGNHACCHGPGTATRVLIAQLDRYVLA